MQVIICEVARLEGLIEFVLVPETKNADVLNCEFDRFIAELAMCDLAVIIVKIMAECFLPGAELNVEGVALSLSKGRRVEGEGLCVHS